MNWCGGECGYQGETYTGHWLHHGLTPPVTSDEPQGGDAPAVTP